MRPRRRPEDRTRPVVQQDRINEQIRVPRVRLVGEDGEQIGIKDTKEALEYAYSKNLDLVEVAKEADPPVARVMDYGKWRYEQEQPRSCSGGGRTSIRSAAGCSSTVSQRTSRSSAWSSSSRRSTVATWSWFKVSAAGKLQRRHAMQSHNLTKKSSKRKRDFGKSHPVAKVDVKAVKKLLGMK